jgi:aconitate hydratase
MLVPPLAPVEAAEVNLERGPNIAPLPAFDALPDELSLPVLLKVGDDISTDEIMPAGARVLPYRSNIPKISEFTFDVIDPGYPARAKAVPDHGGHAVVAGRNYGQGSSREHAALAPRYLGLRVVIALGFARIHWQNLVNFGVLPLVLDDPSDYGWIESGDVLALQNLRREVRDMKKITVENVTRRKVCTAHHDLSGRQVEVLLAGGLVNWLRANLEEGTE